MIPIEVYPFDRYAEGSLFTAVYLCFVKTNIFMCCPHFHPRGPGEKVFHCSHYAGFSSRRGSDVSAPTSSGQHDCWPLSHQGLKSVSGLVAAGSAGK